ncbi:MAG: Hsp20/alpha crystallin family protein [Bacteroidales bacterium]|nr:Hsp20/alpha crystallin family protein [Bacteroidales bacterium]
MTLVRMNRPVSQMNRYRNFSELMNEIFTEERTTNQHFAIPPANIKESKFDFTIELAAPGFEKSDFKIDIDKKLLTVSLDKTVDENEEEKFNLKEFNFNSFNRSFRISDKIDTEKINAVYKNGLLQITLPKREEAIEKPAREIKIS